MLMSGRFAINVFVAGVDWPSPSVFATNIVEAAFLIMFISRKQAEDRLLDQANLCRKGEAVVGDKEKAEEILEKVIAEVTESEEFSIPSLDKLDALIGATRSMQRLEDAREARKNKAFFDVESLLGRGLAKDVLQMERSTPMPSAPEPMISRSLRREKTLKVVKVRVALKGARKLDFVMDQITEEKISCIQDPAELARLGRDIATVTQAMTPKEETSDSSVHFHIYKPELKQETHYETITIGARSDG